MQATLSATPQCLGNPMTQAILQRLKQDGSDVELLSKDWVLKDELSFDVKRKLASYIYQYGNSMVALSSGAPERILENSNRILLKGEESPLTDALRNEVSLAIVQDGAFGRTAFGFWIPQITNRCTIGERNS